MKDRAQVSLGLEDAYLDRIVESVRQAVPVERILLFGPYERGEMPAGYRDDGPVRSGRPPLFGDGMDTLTVRIPVAQKRALQAEAASAGVSLSGYVRQVLALR